MASHVGGPTTAPGPPPAPGPGLTGTWIVTVEPAPGQKFTSLQAYTSDGRVLEDGAPVGRTTAYGSWEHDTGHVYFATTEFLRERDNPPGLEKEHIDRRIELSPGGATFTFSAVVHFRDLNDQDTAPSVNVTGSAQRMAIVHI